MEVADDEPQDWTATAPPAPPEPSPSTPPQAFQRPSERIERRTPSSQPPAPPPPAQPGPIVDDGDSVLPDQFVPEQAAEKRGFASSITSKLGWIAAAVFGAVFIFGFLDSDTSVDDLEVGDCFLAPSEDEISTVETVDCAEFHEYEVFAFVGLSERGSGFPGDAVLFDEAEGKCLAPFRAYIGGNVDATDYFYDIFIPGESSWEAGNRESMCAVISIDEEFNVVSTSGSAKAN